MIEYTVQIGGIISGALIYYGTKDYFNIQKNLFFPIILLLTLVFGVYITQTIHLTERAILNSSEQQRILLYPCIFETQEECNIKVNIINNQNYNNYINKNLATLDLYIGYSLPTSILSNIFLYFCIGVIIVWFINLLYIKECEKNE